MGWPEVSISAEAADVLVPLGSSLLGAVVGGLVTYKVTRQLDAHRRQAEEELRERRSEEAGHWLIVAYLDELARAGGLTNLMLDEGVWTYAGDEFVRSLTREERLTLLPVLSRKDERSLSEAEAALVLVVAATRDGAGQDIDDDGRELLNVFKKRLDDLAARLMRRRDGLAQKLGLTDESEKPE